MGKSIAVIQQTVQKIDAWLETMRNSSGYGGPVTHWWQDCLEYTGLGLDWRYEGIVIGYLNLYECTSNPIWLSKARQAGDDLVAGQLPNGNFRNSSFEANPLQGGTPHEAACDLALIQLARTMQKHNIFGWESYAKAAEQNIRNYIIGQLWMPEGRYFRNLADDPIFVANKAATIVESLYAWQEYSHEEELTNKYILPTLEHILSCQVHNSNSKLNGALDQAQGHRQREGWFFPYYNARCIPALLLGYQITDQDRYLNGAIAVMDFIYRVQLDDGSFPQVINANGRIHRYPQWVAGVGDILRAMNCLEDFSPKNKIPALEWMLRGMLPSGGIQTANGFARRSRGLRRMDIPDYRDLLPVSGWVDKAFRFLTSIVSGEIIPHEDGIQAFEQPCQYSGKECTFHEDEQQIQVVHKNKIYYRWVKGADLAEVYLE